MWVDKIATLRVYIEECSENARVAEHDGDTERVDWWVGEEIEARIALVGAEAA